LFRPIIEINLAGRVTKIEPGRTYRQVQPPAGTICGLRAMYRYTSFWRRCS
jgi:hypothetical protein